MIVRHHLYFPFRVCYITGQWSEFTLRVHSHERRNELKPEWDFISVENLTSLFSQFFICVHMNWGEMKHKTVWISALYFHILSWHFFVFNQKKLCFYHFISLLIKYRISATVCESALHTVKATDWDQGFLGSDWSKPDFLPTHVFKCVTRRRNPHQLKQKLVISICGIKILFGFKLHLNLQTRESKNN